MCKFHKVNLKLVNHVMVLFTVLANFICNHDVFELYKLYKQVGIIVYYISTINVYLYNSAASNCLYDILVSFCYTYLEDVLFLSSLVRSMLQWQH